MKSGLRAALAKAWPLADLSATADRPASTLAWAPAAMADSGKVANALRRPVVQRRRKLWQLPVRMHCPIVGSCLSVAELRRQVARHGGVGAGLSDFELHVQVVATCAQRSALTEGLQRHLDKRHAAAVTRSQQLKGTAAVLAYWQAACQAGDDIAGALWACLTHADLEEEDWTQIEGDVHMLAHQTGAAVRADLRQLARLQQENQQLRSEQLVLRREQGQQQRQLVEALGALEKCQVQLRTQAAALTQREHELNVARSQVRDYAARLERATQVASQPQQQEALLREQARRIEHLLAEQVATRTELQAAEAALESLLGVCPPAAVARDQVAACSADCPPEVQLSGRCVLCIGGRANLVEGYRRLVETRGGRFMHHDGGQEESLRRLDAALISADAVVCQAGCVSHAAYWRLKDACKKLGKPCVFLKSPGVTSFARGLVDLASDASGAAQH